MSSSPPDDSIGDTLPTPEHVASARQSQWESSVERDLSPGTPVGEYVIKRKIGAGGMGLVYEAEQPVIQRRVAIKFLRPELLAENALVEEARLANVVRHRGIVDVYSYGNLGNLGQYLVMEFLEGQPLDAMLAEQGTIEASEVLRILDELLAVLDAAHSRGLVHRDLKPSNLFVVSEPGGGHYVKLLDFGLAKRTHRTSEEGTDTGIGVAVGTPHYMAPEQARGERVTPRTDLYAVGCIAFELLTGRLPFDAPTSMAVMIKQVNDPRPRARTFADVPDALDELVFQLMSQDPKDRPADAAATRATLKSIAKELAAAKTQTHRSLELQATVPARPVAPSTDRALIPAPRRRPVFGAAIALLALGGAAAAFFLWPFNKPEPPPVVTPIVAEKPAPEEQPKPPPVAIEQKAPVEEQIVETPPPVEEEVRPPAVVKKTAATEVKRKSREKEKLPVGPPAHLRFGVAQGRADIYVDGKLVRSTPIPDLEVAPGPHVIKFVAPNGSAVEEKVRLGAGEQRSFHKSWDAVAGKLR